MEKKAMPILMLFLASMLSFQVVGSEPAPKLIRKKLYTKQFFSYYRDSVAQDTTKKDTLNPDKKQEKKKQEKKTKKKLPYEKLFDNKKYQTAKGQFITLHKIGEKVYFELPVKYMKKEMLFGTTVSTVSDPSLLTVGMQYTEPIPMYFEIQDSLIALKYVNSKVYAPKENVNIQAAIEGNFTNPTFSAFKIEAYKPDSTAVVFDMSSLVAKNSSLIQIIPKKMGQITITAVDKPELASARAIKAFDNNISIRTELSYSISASIMGIIPLFKDEPFTTNVTHTFTLLPEQKITPRIADARIGIATTNKIYFPKNQGYIDDISFTQRWDVTPKDKKAFEQGKLTEPEKPIVFYLDNAFPASWKGAISNGVLRWNKAFEKIGFKNVIQLKDFPKNNPDFDPDNLTYSCIRYIPYPQAGIMNTHWSDPHTGQILNASICIYNNIEEQLHQQRFIETAHIDTSVRGKKLPQQAFEQALSHVVAQQIGSVLGLTENLAASSGIPVESLRNKEFTQKYGNTYSIMDQVEYNYVAQPQDQGVNLLPPDLGAYDYYAIDYNYRYFPYEQTPQQQYQELEKMVDKNSVEPKYRYVPVQYQGIYDPTVLIGDLGDDPIKVADYAMKNLKIVTQNLQNWIKDDQDSRIKKQLYLQTVQKNYMYFRNVSYLLGGIIMNNSKENSGVPRYKVISKDKQKQALQWCIQTIKNFKKLSNTELEKKGFIDVSYYDQIIEFLALGVFQANNKIAISWSLDNSSYSQRDFINDLANEIFKGIEQAKTPNDSEMYLQKVFIETAFGSSKGVSQSVKLGQRALSSKVIPSELILSLYKEKTPKINNFSTHLGFGKPNEPLAPKVYAQNKSNVYFYQSVQRLKPTIEKAYQKASNQELKAHYNYLLVKIKKIIDNEQ